MRQSLVTRETFNGVAGSCIRSNLYIACITFGRMYILIIERTKALIKMSRWIILFEEETLFDCFENAKESELRQRG